MGLLCADCSPGMAVGLGTARCIWESRCRTDKVVVWPLLVALVVVAAMVQLTLVSGVWCGKNRGRSTAKAKLLLYFVQVRTCGSWDGAAYP